MSRRSGIIGDKVCNDKPFYIIAKNAEFYSFFVYLITTSKHLLVEILGNDLRVQGIHSLLGS